jgi:gamma-glutamyltranspeptidase/glutathione hydrolase
MKNKAWIKLIVCSLYLLIPASLVCQSGRIAAPAKKGMVVSAHYLASEAGNDILKSGGNAMDAAIATAFTLAVTHPSAGNIGGGGFILCHGADGLVTSFNFREKAPLVSKETMFLDLDGTIRERSNHDGILAVGVPGTVAGLFLAHKRLGHLPWKDVVRPAIRIARKGFPVSWNMQDFLKEMQLENNPLYLATKNAFLKNGKDIYLPGETIRQPDLAMSLKRIRKKGKAGFYEGKTASLIAGFMSEHDGLITLEDLLQYQAVEQPSIHGTYRSYDIYSIGPPSSGGVVLVEMLNMLENYDLKRLGHQSARYLHVLTEVMRRAYSDRAEFLGDPDFNPGMPIERLTSKEYARILCRSIDPIRASKSDSSGFNKVFLSTESEETTHISVIDEEGNAVSLTYTLEQGYGSRITVKGAGFLLNNEMGDFNPVPGFTDQSGLIGTQPNLIAPAKRMLSSMTPTIVAKDGKPVLIIGTPGGRTIINTVLQIILNVVDHGMNISQAIEAGRIHHGWLPDTTYIEKWGFSPDTEKMYRNFGHNTQYREMQGQAMGIFIDYEKKLLYGASDSRSFDGKAIGH